MYFAFHDMLVMPQPGRLERRALGHYRVVHEMLVRVHCSRKVVKTAELCLYLPVIASQKLRSQA